MLTASHRPASGVAGTRFVTRKSLQLASARLISTPHNSMWYFLHFWLLAFEIEMARPESQIAVAQGDGDIVTATALPGQPGVVRVDGITGAGGRLSLDAEKNCVGIAAAETLALLAAALGWPLACGVALQLQKVQLDANFSIPFTVHSGIHPHLPRDLCSNLPAPAAKCLCNCLLQGLPLGSGLGSSAASAAAAAAAVNGLFGGVLPKETLVLAGRLGAARRFHPRQVKRPSGWVSKILVCCQPSVLHRKHHAGAARRLPARQVQLRYSSAVLLPVRLFVHESAASLWAGCGRRVSCGEGIAQHDLLATYWSGAAAF